MSRTRRRDFKGQKVRDGQWPYRCPEGHRCIYCGRAVMAARKAALAPVPAEWAS